LLGLGLLAPGQAAWAARDAAATLVIGDRDVPNSIDPDGADSAYIPNFNGYVNLYDQLIGLASTTNPASLGGGRTISDPVRYVPRLATSWASAKGGSEWTFKLRRGVKSVFGNELTSADVKWTYDRSMAIQQTGAFTYTVLFKVKSLEPLDRYTFRILTNGASPALLPTLASVAELCPIDSTEAKKHTTKKDPWALIWLANNAAGFGPYELREWTKSQSATYVARSNYWGGRPAYQTVKMLAIPSDATRLSTLETGDIEVALAHTAASTRSAAQQVR
jgi:peptide/nickel transport system substrate-binding protein